MADDWRLDPHRYVFQRNLDVRYGDLDSQSCLHEFAIGRMLELLRYELLLTSPSSAAEALQTVIGRISIEQRRIGGITIGSIVGACSIARVGASSFSWSTGLFQAAECYVLSEVTQIAVDPKGKPRRISDAMRADLERWVHPEVRMDA